LFSTPKGGKKGLKSPFSHLSSRQQITRVIRIPPCLHNELSLALREQPEPASQSAAAESAAESEVDAEMKLFSPFANRRKKKGEGKKINRRVLGVPEQRGLSLPCFDTLARAGAAQPVIWGGENLLMGRIWPRLSPKTHRGEFFATCPLFSSDASLSFAGEDLLSSPESRGAERESTILCRRGLHAPPTHFLFAPPKRLGAK